MSHTRVVPSAARRAAIIATIPPRRIAPPALGVVEAVHQATTAMAAGVAARRTGKTTNGTALGRQAPGTPAGPLAPKIVWNTPGQAATNSVIAASGRRGAALGATSTNPRIARWPSR